MEKGNGIFLKVLIVGLLSVFTVRAQEKAMSAEDYIRTYKGLAIEEMKRSGIPASITLAQGLLESGNGNSKLAKEAKNHFGIKCKKGWNRDSLLLDDDKPQECFRTYDKVEDSYKDHTDFIKSGKRYAFLFELDPKDYKGWANGLKQAGYATNPHYPELLITSIEKYKLFDYDQGREPLKDTTIIVATQAGKTEYNGIPAYVVQSGENLESIAKKLNIADWQIRHYNDLEKTDTVEVGTILYLKPKRRKGSQDTYVVMEGQDMYYISQRFGIKLKQLYKKNRLDYTSEPKPGQEIALKSKRKEAPVSIPQSAFVGKRRRGVNIYLSTSEKKENKELKPIQKKDTVTFVRKPYHKPDLPEVDTTLPLRMDSTLQHVENTLQKNYTIHQVQKDSISKMRYSFTEEGSTEPKQEKPYIIEDEPVAKETRETQTTHTTPVQTDSSGFHVVQKGETLYSIGRKYKINPDSVKAWNHLGSNSLAAGQKLFLKASVTSTSEPQPKDREQLNDIQFVENNEAEYHTVEKGESMYGIARKYSISVDKLKELNKLEDNSIKPGQKLRIK